MTTPLANRRLVSAAELLGLLSLTLLVLALRPTGFGGGSADDQRYFEAAIAWLRDPLHVGTTHWELRWPLVLSLAGLFELLEPRIRVALLLPHIAALLLIGLSFAALRHVFGRRAAWIWAAIFVTLPLFVRVATSIFPEILELLFAVASLWAFYFGRRALRPAPWFVAAAAWRHSRS